MHSFSKKYFFSIASSFLMAMAFLALSGCATARSTPVKPEIPAETVATLPALPATPTGEYVRFFEHQVKNDPENFMAQNSLSGFYLKLVRETGDHSHLPRAEAAAKASLSALPPEGNPGGLAALAQVQAASHNFSAARDTARLLVKVAPNKAYTYEILGDAYLELGDYDQATDSYAQVKKMGINASIETRLARLAWLKGIPQAANRHFTTALALARRNSPPTPDVVAWCEWQLGDTAFAQGKFKKAERYYHAALKTYPNYIQAFASLGRLRAARGDLVGAIGYYERAVGIDPMPVFVAALGDLYHLNGRTEDAARQYSSIVDAERNIVDARLDNRQLVLVYADHDLKSDEAYASAASEYAVRKDIYGADAVAWTALKAGRLSEAKTAIKEALRLGTKDARLLYHAGMIARASGDKQNARRYLKSALTLNPQFDPFQAKIARETLVTL